MVSVQGSQSPNFQQSPLMTVLILSPQIMDSYMSSFPIISQMDGEKSVHSNELLVKPKQN